MELLALGKVSLASVKKLPAKTSVLNGWRWVDVHDVPTLLAASRKISEGFTHEHTLGSVDASHLSRSQKSIIQAFKGRKPSIASIWRKFSCRTPNFSMAWATKLTHITEKLGSQWKWVWVSTKLTKQPPTSGAILDGQHWRMVSSIAPTWSVIWFGKVGSVCVAVSWTTTISQRGLSFCVENLACRSKG